jgi:nucleotide-binding universal stress UspA family protein
MKTIKNIIVPTDFSATARNAFNYAQVLAEALDAEITVVHVREFLLPASEIAVMPHFDEGNSLSETMDSFVNLQDETSPTMVKTQVKTKILRGSTTDELVAYSAKNDADLIVMGTTGLQDFVSKIIGTVSLDVANKAHCPVILVPRDATWQPINRIMFAANYASTLPKTVREITDFANLLNANIHFVHINENKVDDDKLMETIWDELFEETDPRISFEMHTIYRGDVVEQLQKYAIQHKIDLLAFVNKKRNFWQNLMHRSITQNVSISIDKPMIVLHYDD